MLQSDVPEIEDVGELISASASANLSLALPTLLRVSLLSPTLTPSLSLLPRLKSLGFSPGCPQWPLCPEVSSGLSQGL